MPQRTVDVEPAPGRIFWLLSNSDTRAIPNIELSKLDHPVLILTSEDSDGLNADRYIQVLIITSFGKQLLKDKFPTVRQRIKRARYVPIGRNPKWSARHPDTGVLLELDITGDPSAPGKDRQSYICLQSPSRVAKHHLGPLLNGTASLTTESLVQVVDMLNKMNCTAKILLPVVTIPYNYTRETRCSPTSSECYDRLTPQSVETNSQHYVHAAYVQPPREPLRALPSTQLAGTSSQHYVHAAHVQPPREPSRTPPRPQFAETSSQDYSHMMPYGDTRETPYSPTSSEYYDRLTPPRAPPSPQLAKTSSQHYVHAAYVQPPREPPRALPNPQLAETSSQYYGHVAHVQPPSEPLRAPPRPQRAETSTSSQYYGHVALVQPPREPPRAPPRPQLAETSSKHYNYVLPLREPPRAQPKPQHAEVARTSRTYTQTGQQPSRLVDSVVGFVWCGAAIVLGISLGYKYAFGRR